MPNIRLSQQTKELLDRLMLQKAKDEFDNCLTEKKWQLFQQRITKPTTHNEFILNLLKSYEKK